MADPRAVFSSTVLARSTVGGFRRLSARLPLDGPPYVGSAYGAGGFWARWENYFRRGHGGNEGMKLLPDHDYQVSILEIASSSLSDEEVIRLEARWKDKILSREFGLNRN